MLQAGLLKAFTDVIVNKENNQHSHIRTFLYLIQVQAVLYAVIQLLPIISFRALPLSKLQMAVTVSNATRTYIHKNTGGICLATYEEAHRVSI